MILEQLNARQKLIEKLPSWVNHPDTIFPPELSLEQSSSEKTAAYKSSIVQGKSFLDLTGGLGIDSFYFAKQFEQAIYVEQNQDLSIIAAHNFKTLGASNIHCFPVEGMAWLKEHALTFDCIYLDPARRDEHQRKVSSLHDTVPNVLEHLELLLNKGKQVLIKTSPMLDITQALKELRGVKAVHIVAVLNECKEVLYLLEKGWTAEPLLHCVQLSDNNPMTLSFHRSEEQQTKSEYSSPLQYLYEPHAALLKAGAYKIITRRYPVKKLAEHSHLYTSGEVLKDFPGRSFHIQGILKVEKSLVQKSLGGNKANLSIRNFPLTVNELRKKLQLLDGGEDYLFATTLANGAKVILHTQKAVL